MVNFKVVDNGFPINYSFDESKKVEDFIKDFLSFRGKFVTTDITVYTFKVGAVVINRKKNLSKELKNFITEGQTIKLTNLKSMAYSK